MLKSLRGIYRRSRPAAALQPSDTHLSLDLTDRLNHSWAGSAKGTRITFRREPLIRRSDKVMTIGSCFAVEVKAVLDEMGFDTYPKYADIAFNSITQHLAKLPETDDLNHYNTWSIRAEFERAFTGEHYGLGDFIEQAAPHQRGIGQRGGTVWRDPFRRHVYATEPEAILDLSHKIDDCFRDAVMQADVYVITLGLIEAWRDDRSGRFLNQAPPLDRSGRAEGYSVHVTSFQENLDNMRAICALIAENFPERKTLITVSPVSFKHTFSGRDLIVANTESKSVLRAVAGQIEREFENVTYWPSYEIAITGRMFDERGREITRDGVRKILSQFAAVHTA